MWEPGIGTSDRWVTATASLPVAFAQVREDPRIDRRLIEKVGSPARALMIASGGETAAVLATLPIESLHMVDTNPAQIALARLKLSMLIGTSTEERLKLLGHVSMNTADRRLELQRRFSELRIAEDALGPPSLVAEWGPDFCARYEWVFARLRETLSPHQAAVADLLSLSDTDQQADRVAPGSELGQAFERASANPFLHQLFSGRFTGPLWDWLDLPEQSELCSLQFSVGVMGEVIATLPDAAYDFVHLSNILDWLRPSAAEKLLNQVYRCLAPGGLVVIRQLNSTLNIPAVPSGLVWHRDLAQQLHREDRSFFYRELHIGTRV